MSVAMHTLWGWLDEQIDHNLRGPSVLVLSVSVCVCVCVCVCACVCVCVGGVQCGQLLHMFRRMTYVHTQYAIV